MIELQKSLKHRFHDQSLLNDAMTHPSFAKSRFELLEFLGDRVLGLAISHILWKSRPSNEKEYARKFVVLTNKDSVYLVAEKLRLIEYIKWRGDSNHRVTIMQDACEALLGALFLDAGFDFTTTFIDLTWQGLNKSDFYEFDPKSELQTWASKRQVEFSYIKISESGPPHLKKYVIELSVQGYKKIRGESTSIRAAEKDAAAKFMKENIYVQ